MLKQKFPNWKFIIGVLLILSASCTTVDDVNTQTPAPIIYTRVAHPDQRIEQIVPAIGPGTDLAGGIYQLLIGIIGKLVAGHKPNGMPARR